MDKALLGVDLGTTSLKAVVYSPEGEVVSEKDVAYPTFFPRPMWAEQNPEDWWNAFRRAVRHVVAEARGKGFSIAAIALDSQREGVVPVSRSGRPLANCIIWMDRRSWEEARMIGGLIGEEEVYRRTGLVVEPTYTATKILWLKKHMPSVFEKTWVFLQPKEYINYRLTGVAATDPSLASRTMLFNVSRLEWDDDVACALGIPLDKMPEVKSSDEIIGVVSGELARSLGLPDGCPVINGGGDRQCEALGAGVVGPGVFAESTGTATNVMTSASRPVFDVHRRILVSCHVVKGYWLKEAGTSPTGAILKWFRDLAYQGEPDPYEAMNREAEKSPPGANGVVVLPYFMGSRAPLWRPYMRGLIAGLSLGISRGDVVRGIMEGIALLIREILETYDEIGFKASRIRLLGGAARSRLWNTIKASVLGMKVEVLKEYSAASLGAAVLAGVAVGIYHSPIEAAERLLKVEEVVSPREEWVQIYDDKYRDFKKVSRMAVSLYGELKAGRDLD